MTGWQKKCRWQRTWPGETGIDGKPYEDYAAYDGEQYAGRIRLELANLAKGKWHWAGAHPKPFYGEPIMPNAGYLTTAEEAAQMVERYWDAMKAKNGKMPGRRSDRAS